MPRRYSVVFESVAVSAVQDLFEVRAGSGSVCELLSIHLGQSSDAGDSEDEQLPWKIIRSGSAATSGSVGTSATPRALDTGDPAADATAEVNNTTQISGGTPVTLHADAFNIRAGMLYVPTPEERIIWSNQEYLTVDLDAAPADALTMSGTLIFQEIG